jgi:hypothetical protein
MFFGAADLHPDVAYDQMRQSAEFAKVGNFQSLDVAVACIKRVQRQSAEAGQICERIIQKKERDKEMEVAHIY